MSYGLGKRQIYHALINMYCFEFAVILKEWRVIDLVCMKHILTILTQLHLIEMSDNDKELESAQKDQKKIGKAESDPDTSGPAENLREEAAEMTDESQDSKEPA